jgi:hypothetical protein
VIHEPAAPETVHAIFVSSATQNLLLISALIDESNANIDFCPWTPILCVSPFSLVDTNNAQSQQHYDDSKMVATLMSLSELQFTTQKSRFPMAQNVRSRLSIQNSFHASAKLSRINENLEALSKPFSCVRLQFFLTSFQSMLTTKLSRPEGEDLIAKLGTSAGKRNWNGKGKERGSAPMAVRG